MTLKDYFYEYSLLMWDGLGFFGFDDTKIARLRGVKVTFWTPFTSKKQTVILIISIIVAVNLILNEVKKLGTLKSQEIQLVPIKGYSYNVTQAIPLVSANWWFIDELFPRIRAF